jgi:hypothetical protein
VTEHWRNNALNQAVGEYIFQLEFYFAGIFAQGNKVPVAS